MRKRFLTLGLAVLMAVSLTACGGGDDSSKKEKTTTEAKKEEKTYESIYNEYSAKLTEATPRLIDEYEQEIEADDSDEISIGIEKADELMGICTEGTEKMSDLLMENPEEEDEYDKWAGKLEEIYNKESDALDDAFGD
nr:hypothetical protein [uncultured Anaerostipes sp.]